MDIQIYRNSLNIIGELLNHANLLYIGNRNIIDINYLINISKRVPIWGKIVNFFTFNSKKVIEKQEIELKIFNNHPKNELLIELDKLHILSRNINIYK
jgi:hypothetical protein